MRLIKVPGLQDIQEVDPVLLAMLPTPQVWHIVAPEPLEKEPTEHGLQEKAPIDPANVPAVHAVQLEKPVLEA